MKWPLWLVSAWLCAGAAALAQAPLYISLAANRPAASGCELAPRREVMVSQLREMGYNGRPPAIAWKRGQAAVLVLSSSGFEKPYSYAVEQNGARVRVTTTDDPGQPPTYLYVMQINADAASAQTCVVSRAADRVYVPPRAVTSAEPPMTVKGAAAGNRANQQAK